MRADNVNQLNQVNQQNVDQSSTHLAYSDALKKIEDQNQKIEKDFNLVKRSVESAHNVGKDILASAASGMAKTTAFRKVTPEDIEEYRRLSNSGVVDEDDSPLSLMAKKIKVDTRVQSEMTQINVKGDAQTKAQIDQYIALYGQYLQGQSPLVKKELEKLEQQLKSRGVTEQQLIGLRQSLSGSVRSEVVSQIRDAFKKFIMSSENVVELAVNTRGMNDVLDSIWGNAKLGGEDFGGYNTNLQGTVDRVAEETKNELKTFLMEALKEKMTRKLVANDAQNPNEQKYIREELKDLLALAKKIGFDVSEYAKQWQKDKFQEGLFLFYPPKAESLLSAETNMGQGKQKDSDEVAAVSGTEENEELLMNRLRALYMRNALKGDVRTSLNTMFKIRKTKNGLIRLGIFSNDLNDQVKKEAENIARIKMIEMLKEGLQERATLFKLSGPAYELVESKIMGVMKNTKRLGVELSEAEFNMLKDKANYEVFEVAKRELRLTDLALKVTGDARLSQKRDHLVMLLTRLKEESHLDIDLESVIPELESSTKTKA